MQSQSNFEELQKKFVDLQAQFQEQEKLLQERNHHIVLLEEQVLYLRRLKFAAQSEKLKEALKNQLGLFNEAEFIVEEDQQDIKEAIRQEIKSYKRGKPKRRPLPDYIEREEEVIELSKEEQVCSQGHGLVEIGQETNEQLDIIPMQLKVKRTIRKKYVCKTCQGEVKTAARPSKILPKSNAAEGLLAHIAVSKYADGLPLYRQSKMFERCEIDLSRSTMASWMVKLGQAVEPILNLMREDITSSNYIQCDETPIQVLKEENKKATSKSYMWVYGRASPKEKPIIMYEYDSTRSGRVPASLFEEFEGYLQVDGYDGYNQVCAKKEITRVGCMAHARRKFFEASKVSKKKGLAGKGLSFIQKLYKIEKEIQKQNSDQRHQKRQEKAKPISEDFKHWLDQTQPTVPPKMALGKAIAYAQNEWAYLSKYIENPILRIDNNFIENKIRPFAIGRKNWLFANTPNGANASANLYSLIETAKANNLNPFTYLQTLFLKLPKMKTLEKIETLLPYNIKL